MPEEREDIRELSAAMRACEDDFSSDLEREAGIERVDCQWRHVGT